MATFILCSFCFFVTLFQAIFLEVEINACAVASDSGGAAMRRSMSFGSLTPSLSINDFNVIKVLGKGR